MFKSKKPTTKKIKLSFVLIMLLMVSIVSLAQADAQPVRPDRPLPASVDGLRLDTPVTIDDAVSSLKLDSELIGAEGTQRVIVNLSEAPVALVAVNNQSRTAQYSQRGRIYTQQNDLIARAASLDGGTRILARANNALNAVVLDVDASALADLALSSDVIAIHKVTDYELDLSETVPYIGATAVQNAGFDGTGVRVAVLDSGVDYYHANLGGSGDPNDYANDDPSVIEPGTFPTAKVTGGFDFVGSNWVSGLLTEPDPDPLDDGSGAGHGTHVSDIIGGLGGVAPGVEIYGVKVCSSISTSCSGVALIQGMDFALDPNGDGILDDAVDIINMSLGSNYGTAFDDDLSQAVENAAAAGVLTVSSAGNGSDKPYITGTPSNTKSALGVAQTNVPSAFQPLMEVTAPAGITGLYNAAFQPWSVPLTSIIEAPMIYGDGAGGNLDGCAPFTTDLSGFIVLVDRGACNFTLKISNISQAGGAAGIIGLVAPGDPFGGGDGGDRPIDIPGYMISQDDSNTLKSGLPDTVVRFDPASGIPLVMHMVGSSSRGPSIGTNLLKPEIGAPGASVSAIAGSGTNAGPFGGTSGASPMVAGSAALLMQAYPDRSWSEIKALIMNTGETDIINKADVNGGDLAPISRIGGGEVRVDRALDSPIAAWDSELPSGGLSFGFHDISSPFLTLRKTVVVRNYSGDRVTYGISSSFRYQNDEDTGAVTINTPNSITIPPYGTRTFQVRMRINTALVHDWTMNSGSGGADPARLTLNEFDGYLWLDNLGTAADDANPVHMAWHVLPRKASHVIVAGNGSPFQLTNTGIGDANVESYSLIGVSGNLPEGGPGEQNPTPDFRYLGYTTIPVPAGFCGPNDSFILGFAVNSWEPQSHATIPTSYWINLDVDQDPTTGGGPFGSEYTVLTRDFTLTNVSDGRNLTWVVDWSTGAAGAFFFTDHDTNSSNTAMFICGDQIGMDASNFFDPMDITAQATDFYYGGNGDQLDGITISPLGEQYLGIFDSSGSTNATIPFAGHDTLDVLDFGFITNNTETGLLLLYRQGAGGAEAKALQIAP